MQQGLIVVATVAQIQRPPAAACASSVARVTRGNRLALSAK